MSYPGGKGNVYHKIINIMPPHDTYIETHLGGGYVMRMKRPASRNVGIDVDGEVLEQTRSDIPYHVELVCSDAVEYLRMFKFSPKFFNTLVYADPPYLMSTRRSGPLYKFEYTDKQHEQLLDVLTSLPCPVIISGYWSMMYGDLLEDWNHFQFEAMTRGGKMATEHVWYNYDEPVELHDYRYLGDNFRERERIKRKKARWTNRLRKMPLLEKRALLSAIEEADSLGILSP
jgi:DNA adenine methylase